jgi:arginine-tRNA-protein transferase
MELSNAFLNGHCTYCTPIEIDQIWADGWRNFGAYFFRNQFDYIEAQQEWVNIIPLRINLEKFSWRKHQSKLLRRSQGISTVRYQPIAITPSVAAMFQKHIQRFSFNPPESLTDFLGESPGIIPTAALECALYDEQGLHYASSYFGIGATSISSIYATFDTDFSSRSPGLHTLLAEIQYAQQHNKQFVYLGYAHDVASYYDYKKNFNGLEYYDWEGNWLDYK